MSERVARVTMDVLTFLAICALAIVATIAITGCATGGSWSSVAFKSASLSGKMVISTPGGPVTIDLATGIATGDGEVEVLSADVRADVEIDTGDGNSLRMTVVSPGRRGEDGWRQCVQAIIDGSAGMMWGSPRWCYPPEMETSSSSQNATDGAVIGAVNGL